MALEREAPRPYVVSSPPVLETPLSCFDPPPPSSPPPTPADLSAGVTATPARASYHRISAPSPFQRAHGCVGLILSVGSEILNLAVNTCICFLEPVWYLSFLLVFLSCSLLPRLCVCGRSTEPLWRVFCSERRQTKCRGDVRLWSPAVPSPTFFFTRSVTKCRRQFLCAGFWKSTLLVVKHLGPLSHGSAKKQGLDVFH